MTTPARGVVGDQAVLTDCNHQILGLEEKALEIGAHHSRTPPVARNVGQHQVECTLLHRMTLERLLDPLAARLQKEGGLRRLPLANERADQAGKAATFFDRSHAPSASDAAAGLPSMVDLA